MSNEIGTKKTENNAALDQPRPNPFPGTEGAVEEQEAVLIATDDYVEEDALPPWLDPRKFSFSGGVGYSLYNVRSRRTMSRPFSMPTTHAYWNDGLFEPEADQFSSKIDIAYRPFVGKYTTFGITGGYQAIPSLGGHEVMAGIGFNSRFERLSWTFDAHYAHLWADDLDLGIPQDSIIPAESFPEELSLHGIGGCFSFGFSITDYFSLETYINVDYFTSEIKQDPSDSVFAVTPGIRGVVHIN